jgi:hypothetical protein
MSHICAGDWMGIRVGEYIHHRDNPRHVARIEVIHNSWSVKLRWVDSRWTEFVTLPQIRKDFQKTLVQVVQARECGGFIEDAVR